MATDLANIQNVPVAHAHRSSAQPLDGDGVVALAKPFAGTTVGQKYLGPAWVGDDGTPFVVLVAHDERWLRRLRTASECAFIAWRWNNSPSTYFSLTLMLKSGSPRPHVRWMRPSDDAVVQTIRRDARFLATVVNVRGQHYGWYEATFGSGFVKVASPSNQALERLWAFPTPGISCSNINVRFDPLRRKEYKENREEEIPLWAEPTSDFWRTLGYDGPWTEDLGHIDRVMAAWARQAVHNRQTAAGFIQVLLERQHLDGEAPVFSVEGRLLRDCPVQPRIVRLVRTFPLIGQWLATMAGPTPDARHAYDAALAVLFDAPTLLAMLRDLFGLLSELDDEDVSMACKTSFEAALLDTRITKEGTLRPWLANSEGGGMSLKTLSIDLAASIESIEVLWRSGMELIDLIDAGLYLTPSDFPAPLSQVCTALESVVLEGSIDEAETRISALLVEAQEARQWSIPWGARVEISFGSFVALRVFELDGEFVCHFLNEEDRYFTVAIGLRHQPPRSNTLRILRGSGDDTVEWNEDAEASLKLIAAAIVRDFLVVEEREALFGVRPLRRRVRGRNIRTVIYLPRVRYSTPHPQRIEVEGEPAGRARHQVAPHLRRAATASAAQRFLAQRYGMHMPEGFTFVRPHERGTATAEARIRVYRSRSASRMIFDAVSQAPAGARPAWFDFEKDCARLLARRGLLVIHQSARRDGDGGVDLYAVNGEGQSWVVQCKCWAQHRSIGPEIVRELAGAIALADKGATRPSEGILITTSTFTSGAAGVATEFGFELIDGTRLTNLLTNEVATPSN